MINERDKMSLTLAISVYLAEVGKLRGRGNEANIESGMRFGSKNL